MRLRQFDIGAVASLEARFAYLHFLPLKTWRDATDEDDNFCVSYLSQELFWRYGDLVLNVERQSSEPFFLHVVELYSILFPCLHLHFLLCALYAMAHFPDVNDCVSIDNESQHVVATDIEQKSLVACRDESALIAC